MNAPGRPVLAVIDSMATGGAQDFLLELARHLPRPEIDLRVACLRSHGLYADLLRATGSSVTYLSPGRNLLWLPLSLTRLWRLLGRVRPFLVHSFLEGSFTFATPLAALRGIPTVHSMMGLRSQSAAWYFQVLRRYQRMVAAYVTPVPGDLVAAGIDRERIKLAEVVIDIRPMLKVEHDPGRRIAGLDLEGAFPVAVSVGRLEQLKGHEHAIRAWPGVIERYPAARLLIVGTGSDLARLQGLASSLGCAHAVVFPGHRQDLDAIYARADLFLRTTLYEGVNICTVLAMAAALPVIALRCSAPREIVDPGRTGLLMPMGDAERLATAITELSSSPERRLALGGAAREGVRRYYDIDAILGFHYELYRTVARGRPLAELKDMAEELAAFSTVHHREG